MNIRATGIRPARLGECGRLGIVLAVPGELHIYRDPPLDGPTNMARDEHLMYANEARPAALRLYGWNPPTLSLGCFQRYADVAGLPAPLCDWPVVRRPTGGGAIVHDREVTYCLSVDESTGWTRRPPADLYHLVHRLWRDAIAADGPALELAPDSLPFPSPRRGPFFCFAKPGRTDLIVSGGKVLGSAQRRAAGRVMQHGSLLLDRPRAGDPGADLGAPPPDCVAGWVERFVALLANALSLAPVDATWLPGPLADVAFRRKRFADPAWTRRH